MRNVLSRALWLHYGTVSVPNGEAVCQKTLHYGPVKGVEVSIQKCSNTLDCPGAVGPVTHKSLYMSKPPLLNF